MDDVSPAPPGEERDADFSGQLVATDTARRPDAQGTQARALSGVDLLDLLDVMPDSSAPGGLVDGTPHPARRGPADVKVIAFYLPQFHPFDENDRWWGDGFTEWTNVVGARPQFEGHRVPALPADLGFYDLRVADVRRRQADLAAEYGIDGFCYYYYWFSGRRVMNRILDDILHSGAPSSEFCLCWANESWSRRWDGSEGSADMLIRQEHDPDIDATLIDDLLPFFRDERYITVDGAPLLLVYRLGIMREPEKVIAAWKKAARAAGFPDLFVAAVRSFGLQPEDARMVDAVVDFPPHTAVSPEIQSQLACVPGFGGKIYDYRQVVVNSATERTGFPLNMPGIMPRWDNTSRKGHGAHIFANSSPSTFRLWADLALQQAAALPEGRRLLFINSWNEWAEGAMLEPDRVHGRSYLEALRQARGGYIVAPAETSRFALTSGLKLSEAEAFLRGLATDIRLVASMMARARWQTPAHLVPGPPEILSLYNGQVRRSGSAYVDYASVPAQDGTITIAGEWDIELVGWAMFDPAIPHPAHRVGYLTLREQDNPSLCYHLPIYNWLPRTDVAAHFKIDLDPEACAYGFKVHVAVDGLAVGNYRISLMQVVRGEILGEDCAVRICRT